MPACAHKGAVCPTAAVKARVNLFAKGTCLGWEVCTVSYEIPYDSGGRMMARGTGSGRGSQARPRVTRGAGGTVPTLTLE